MSDSKNDREISMDEFKTTVLDFPSKQDLCDEIDALAKQRDEARKQLETKDAEIADLKNKLSRLTEIHQELIQSNRLNRWAARNGARRLEKALKDNLNPEEAILKERREIVAYTKGKLDLADKEMERLNNLLEKANFKLGAMSNG